MKIMFSDRTSYFKKQIDMLGKYEDICKRCGACCGLEDGDPCVNLQNLPDGKYYCKVYDNRLGTQRTVSGRFFTCVPIRDNLKYGQVYSKCAYAKGLV